MAKALACGADVAVLDLEDACPEAEKESARDSVRTALDGPRRALAYVRINALSTGLAEADLQALVGGGLDGIMLPKAESANMIRAVDRLITMFERRRGLTEGQIDLVPLVETASGVAEIGAIAAACARVRRFAFGSVDFAFDLGLHSGDDEIELHPYRAALVLGAKISGAEPPIDSACLHVDRPNLTDAAARRSRAMGFQGKLCIHPSQVTAVNAAFVPTPAELAKAERIVAAFAAAEASGSAAVKVDGELVDYPVFRRARQLVSRALVRTMAGAEAVSEHIGDVR